VVVVGWRQIKTTLIALLALGVCLPAAGADKDKPLPKDFKSLKALAEKGNAGAQFNLGLMYAYGTGVLEDFKEAVKWDEMDRCKRILGNVYLGREWVNLELVKAGLAWHYKFYSKDKTMAAAQTKAAKRGIWSQGSPVGGI
jgi:hypothetical protein